MESGVEQDKTFKRPDTKLEVIETLSLNIRENREEELPKVVRRLAVDIGDKKIIGCASLKKILLKKDDFILFQRRSSERVKERLGDEGEESIFLTGDLIETIIKKKVFMIGTDLSDIKNVQNRSIKEYLESQGSHVITNFKIDSKIIDLALK